MTTRKEHDNVFIQEKVLHTSELVVDQKKEMPYPQVREMRSQDTVRKEGAVK
jgi:hypothetical protein